MKLDIKTVSQRNGGLEPLPSGWVSIVAGVDLGKAARLNAQQTVTVGTGDRATLRLTDGKVSRLHCELSLAGPAFRLRDLGSKNGTWFEGSNVSDAVVPRGAVVRIGDSHLVLRVAPTSNEQAVVGPASFPPLVGDSPAMRQVYAELAVAARSNATVLLLGETGTGKGAAAAALHQASQRRSEAFETFDCGAVVASLLAAELFGVTKGAFTDASATRPGAFERAHRGTLFLDEIGELPLDLQPTLLGVCESQRVTRIGGTTAVPADVRLIAATRRDLAREVAEGRFRQDLFYRLEVLRVVMPPVRSRLSDLPALINALAPADAALGPIVGPNLALLEAYAWPGNVRELRNALQRAMALAEPGTPFTALRFQLHALAPPTSGGPGGFMELKREVVGQFERSYLEHLLELTQRNVRRAAREAGLDRTHFKRLLRKYGLKGTGK